MDRFLPLAHVASHLRSEMAPAAPPARPAKPSPQDALVSALATLPAIEAIALPTPDVDRADKHGNTALMLAAANGDYTVVVELHEAGGDVTLRNVEGHSALMIVLRALRRCSDSEDRVRYSLTLGALLGVLRGMMDKGGLVKDRARVILEAGCEEARNHEQAEHATIVQILAADEKGC